MAKYVKPHFDEDQLGNNPCLQSFKLPISRLMQKNAFRPVDNGSIGSYNMPVYSQLEYRTYTRVYNQPELRKYMVNLSDRALRLYMWLIYEAESNKDYLWLNHLRYMDENHIKAYNTYKDARDELIRYSFIVRTCVTGVFWLNPTFFFSGNPIQKFPKNIIYKVDQKQ